MFNQGLYNAYTYVFHLSRTTRSRIRSTENGEKS